MAKTPQLRHLEKLFKTARLLNPGFDWEQLQSRRQSRREFLSRALQLGLAAAPLTQLIVGCATSQTGSKLKPLKGKDDPVIIIGGGISGLTAAFYLARAGIASCIYEGSHRIGGRMFTREKFNADHMICELGGEFVDSDHTDIAELCSFFNIPLDRVDVGTEELASNLYYFPDRHGVMRYYTDKDALEALKVFDRRFVKDQMSLENPERFKHFDSLTLEQYLDQYRGEVDPWFLDLLRVAFEGESGLDANVQAASNFVAILSPDTHSFKIFGESDQAKRIRGGNQTLITALERWLKEQGVRIETNSTLVAVAEKSQKLSLTFGMPKSKPVEASRVICTLPYSVLRNVDGIYKLPLNPMKKRAISEMAYGTNGKYMLGFAHRVWRKEMARAGKSSVPASNGMVYTHRFVQNLWETSAGQLGHRGILTAYLGGKNGATLSLKDRGRTLAAIHEIFPGTESAQEKDEALFNWSQYQFTRGSYSWSLPGQAPLFEKAVKKQELGGRLVFAGEHLAPDFGGFMNGACMSGRHAALAVLGERSEYTT